MWHNLGASFVAIYAWLTFRDLSMSNKLLAFAFIVVSLLICVPILTHPHLPMVDLPNHIARLYIAASSGTKLDIYYDYQLGFRTNMAADLIWLSGFHKILSVETFANFLMAFYAVAFTGSLMILGRTVLGHWSAWPLAANLLVFNEVYFWGFQNYLITIPFSILAITGWLACENKSILWRVLAFIPVCLILYFMHVLGLLIFMVAVFGREIQRLIEAGQKWREVMVSNLPLAIPFLIPLAFIYFQMLEVPAGIYQAPTLFGGLYSRLELLTSPFSSVTSDQLPKFNIFSSFMIPIFYLVVAKTGMHGKLRLNRRMKGPLVALAVLTLLAPATLNGVAYVHIRFPFVFLGLLFASMNWERLTTRQIMLLTGMVGALTLGRVVMVERLTVAHSQDVEQMNYILETIPPGSRILAVRNFSKNGSPRLWHMQAYAIPIANSFVPTLFIGTHALQLKPQWLDRSMAVGVSAPWDYLLETPSIPANIPTLDTWTLLVDWNKKFTHVLQLNLPPDGLLKQLPLSELISKGDFALYEIED